MGKAAKGRTGKWSISDIPSQAGRRVLVTGANSGIGYYAALELARKGAHVLLACRNTAKGEQALTRLRANLGGSPGELAATGAEAAEVIALDLASFASIRACAEAQSALGLPLDVLINNAGVMTPPQREETEDGFELQFGTNVLGHFLLTALLMPALEKAANTSAERPRVVTLASVAHKEGKLNFDDLQSEKSYKSMVAYQQSKLADLMFAFEFARRLRSTGSKIISVAAHPGVANTNLFKAHEYGELEAAARQAMSVAIGVLLNTEVGGALPTLYAATAEDVVDGGYYGPQGFLEFRGGDVGAAKVAPQALDEPAAARLWAECERLTSTRFLS
jgi:NAD(P)-dependent dehydrogenase (short-subunit alcohol dehydrogenase family)